MFIFQCRLLRFHFFEYSDNNNNDDGCAEKKNNKNSFSILGIGHHLYEPRESGLSWWQSFLFIRRGAELYHDNYVVFCLFLGRKGCAWVTN